MNDAVEFAKQGDWEFIIGGENYGLHVRPDHRAKVPCWFHRFMQRFMLGIVWRKVNNE